ncbi:MAG: phytanoyl-CoA dioxygenase family protein [Labilithrix sp.]|nr:phytanoyl-CoA dioxygenase family protein [Labilithrix sp.]
MISGLLRDVTQAEIDQYRETGAVRLEGILGEAWLGELGAAIEDAIYKQWGKAVSYDITDFAEKLKGMGELTNARAQALENPGRFLTVIGAWTTTPWLRRFALESPLGYIAGRLFGAKKVCFYDDQVLIKEPRSKQYTAFHTDEPYYHLAGTQTCAMWVSPDLVDADASPMEYVRGSHRWKESFLPNNFANQATLDQLGLGQKEDGAVRLPDIEGNRGEYDIVTYTSKPGDVLVHHSRLVHGSGPNYTDKARRAGSFRYVGDDVTYRFNKMAPPQPHQKHALNDGDSLECEAFPRVWSAP